MPSSPDPPAIDLAELDEWDHEFAPWDGRRVPVTLLGGYLGAGKTTVLNELLAATDRPIAVIVNDIGQVNIDADLVKARHGDTIELTDGCICCSLNQGLGEAFDQLRDRAIPPDHLVIELSGAADPRRVMPWCTSAGFSLDGLVVLVDAEQFSRQADDADIGALVRAQVAAADLLLLSKTDLVPTVTVDEVREELAMLAPRTRVVLPPGPGVSATLLGLGGRRPGGIADVPTPSLFDPHMIDTRPFPDDATEATVAAMLDDLPTSTVRAKGVARADDGRLLLVQVVGHRRSVTVLPDAETQPPTDLVIISLE